MSDRCKMPPRPKGDVPGFKTLPDHMVGCRLAAHGNSSPSKAGRTALSMHTPRADKSVADKRTLFNVAEPVIFRNAELRIDQRAGQEGAKRTSVQVITWPEKRKCKTDADCTGKGEVCAPKAKRCASKRRKKTPFAYVIGEVHHDDGIVRATPVALFAGRIDEKTGAWVEAKYFNPVTCREEDKAKCPAITSARTVRFVPNPADGKHAQPFSVTLDGNRRRKRRRSR
jgi:hypothetical protein